jgi:hypothetical protein
LPQRNFTATLALRVESQPKNVYIYILFRWFVIVFHVFVCFNDLVWCNLCVGKKEPTHSLFMFFLMLFFNDYFQLLFVCLILFFINNVFFFIFFSHITINTYRNIKTIKQTQHNH